MKVVLIYRQKRPGGHSIEGLFHTIAEDLRKQVEVIEYECGPRWHSLIDAWRLRKQRADIYHITGDIHYLTLLLPTNKTVLTVHDLYHYTHQLKGWKRWIFKWLWLILPIRSARAVTVISQETLHSIHDKLGIYDKEISVIGDCVNPIFRRTPKPFNKTRPVILQVGTRPNKNLSRTIQALRGIPCRLSIIGQLDAKMLEELKQVGLDYEHGANLDLDGVFQKYVEADVVCFASLYEGFGMPIIEAQAIGRPLITSDRSPMKEVAGAGACLANPESVEQIRDCILRILHNEDYRSRLVICGLENAERHAASAVGNQYCRLYKTITP